MKSKMTYDEACKIVGLWEDNEERSCTCFQNPPCSKCVNQPSEELYEEALTILDDY